MLRKTHMAVGIAAALAVTHPQTAGEYLNAILGGTVGGLISDIDVQSNDLLVISREEKQIFKVAAGVTILTLLLNLFTKDGIFSYIHANLGFPMLFGAVVFAALCFLGRQTGHRSFTHSLLALFLWSGCLYFACLPLVPSFAVGMLSHILLDLTNRKRVRILYPLRKGFCLRWCYSNRIANKVCFLAGLATIFLQVAVLPAGRYFGVL